MFYDRNFCPLIFKNFLEGGMIVDDEKSKKPRFQIFKKKKNLLAIITRKTNPPDMFVVNGAFVEVNQTAA